MTECSPDLAQLSSTYLVAAGGDVRGQSLHLAVEDVVLLHLILHGGQVLSKALVVQVVLGGGRKEALQSTSHRQL